MSATRAFPTVAGPSRRFPGRGGRPRAPCVGKQWGHTHPPRPSTRSTRTRAGRRLRAGIASPSVPVPPRAGAPRGGWRRRPSGRVRAPHIPAGLYDDGLTSTIAPVLKAWGDPDRQGPGGADRRALVLWVGFLRLPLWTTSGEPAFCRAEAAAVPAPRLDCCSSCATIRQVMTYITTMLAVSCSDSS